MHRDKKKRINKPSSVASQLMPKPLAGGDPDNVQMGLDCSVRELDGAYINMKKREEEHQPLFSRGKSQISESPCLYFKAKPQHQCYSETTPFLSARYLWTTDRILSDEQSFLRDLQANAAQLYRGLIGSIKNKL